MTDPTDGIVALGARVHLFVHPDLRGKFTALFADVLDCTVLERDFGLEHPILFVPFPDGSGFSVEFSTLAPRVDPSDTINDLTANRGAWIEFRTTHLPRDLERLKATGVPAFRHTGSEHTYFSAPGGQVFRLLDISYAGP
jgi:hypothetical protein